MESYTYTKIHFLFTIILLVFIQIMYVVNLGFLDDIYVIGFDSNKTKH